MAPNQASHAVDSTGDPLDLTVLSRRYLLWIETHHYARSTVDVRRLTLTFFIAWCDVRSITRADQVTRELLHSIG